MARLRVGQAYGVFYRPRFGLAVPAPTSLSTQPPSVMQALMRIKSFLIAQIIRHLPLQSLPILCPFLS